MKKENIIVSLLASDFKNTNFVNSTDCALARALKRTFKTEKFRAGVSWVKINGIRYDVLNAYGYRNYSSDKALAEKFAFDSSVIRMVEIKEATIKIWCYGTDEKLEVYQEQIEMLEDLDLIWKEDGTYFFHGADEYEVNVKINKHL